MADQADPGPERGRKSPPAPPRRFRNGLILFLVILGGLNLISLLMNRVEDSSAIPYSEFNELLASGRIESVQVGREVIRGTLKGGDEPRQFRSFKIEDPTLAERLAKAKIRHEGIRESDALGITFSWLIPFLLMVLIWRAIFKGAAGGGLGGGAPVFGMSKSKARVYAETDVSIRFTDVAGVGEAKEELTEVIQFLKDPEKYGRLGGRVPKGILLVGPPGTGKTLLARAVAGEAQVPFYSINGSEFVELFVGLGAARVRDLFVEARAHAPCIIFIDELDAMGKARGISVIGGGANDEKEQTLNQLLAEIDGFDPTKGVILIAATNRPEILDPALLRSGRFDRQILIDKPDRIGRAEIIKVHLRKVKADPALKIEEIAALTPGLSGADLANLVNEAALSATRRKDDMVTMVHLTLAFERVVGGVERKSRVISPEDRRRVAYHELGHAVTSMALGKDEEVHKVSIIPRGISALGYTMRRPTEDRYLWTQRDLEFKVAILLGGRVAEEVFLKESSTGSADDLEKATEIARAMVTQYGMSARLGLPTLERAPSTWTAPLGGITPELRAAHSESTAREIDREVGEILDRAHEQAGRIVTRYSEMIELLCEKLLRAETLTQAELKEEWDRYQQGPYLRKARLAQ